MLDMALDVGDASTSIALIPGAIELLGGGPELYDQVAGKVLRVSLTTLLAPEPNQSGFIAAHEDAGVRAADERAPTLI
jgi:hypothetical protein